jgi:peptidoglycan hydrolase CwlO-like protein
MSEQEREQNKRINQHQRLINNLRERLKTIEEDVEPEGRIAQAFEQIEQHLERHDKRFDRLEHKVNQLGSKLDIIIEHLTSINDLPDE